MSSVPKQVSNTLQSLVTLTEAGIIRLQRPDRALRTAVGLVGGRIINVDATVVCEQPRLGPHRAEMERVLGEATSARVSVKATTNEGMGWVGRGEGIACIAVVQIDDP